MAMALETGSDTDQLLRCMLTLTLNQHDRMPYPVTAYRLDWQPTPGLPTGGMPTAQIYPGAEHFTDTPQLDATASRFAARLASVGAVTDPAEGSWDARHCWVPHRRLGAALVVEIDALPEFDDQTVRQVLAYDLAGTFISIVQTPADEGPRWWIAPHDAEPYGDKAASIDYATVRPQLEPLAWAHVHGVNGIE